jgi:hypothetical protein
MLPFPMITAKSHPFASGTNCSPHLHPLHSVRCHPACTVYPEPRREPSRSERSEGSAFLLPLATRHSPLTTIPFRITFFAYPHPLTPIESHSCKNRGEGGPFTPSRVRGASCLCATRRNPRNPNLFMGLLHNSRTPRGVGPYRQKEEFQFTRDLHGTRVTEHGPLLRAFYPQLTTRYPLLTLRFLKPPLQMAHPYLCTCKKGPAARETRYPPCAVS